MAVLLININLALVTVILSLVLVFDLALVARYLIKHYSEWKADRERLKDILER